MRTAIITAMLMGCYTTHTPEPPPSLGTAGAPAPAPVPVVLELAPPSPEPEALEQDACGNTSEYPQWFFWPAGRSAHQCGGTNRRFCCDDVELDGEHYNPECAGFCEPGAVAMIDRDGHVIDCVDDGGQCGGPL